MNVSKRKHLVAVADLAWFAAAALVIELIAHMHTGSIIADCIGICIS